MNFYLYLCQGSVTQLLGIGITSNKILRCAVSPALAVEGILGERQSLLKVKLHRYCLPHREMCWLDSPETVLESF